MDRAALRRLGEYIVVAEVIAVVLGFVGYAAAISYKAWLKSEAIDPEKIGTNTFFVAGALGLIGAFALRALQTW